MKMRTGRCAHLAMAWVAVILGMLAAPRLAPGAVSRSGDVSLSTGAFDGYVFVGMNTPGQVGIDGGTAVHSFNVLVGYGGQSDGSQATITGPGSAWSVQTGFEAGRSRPGTLTVSNGGHLDAEDLLIAEQATAAGSKATFAGPGTNARTYHIEVGYGGTGTLEVTGGAVFQTQVVRIGDGSAGGNLLTLRGAGTRLFGDPGVTTAIYAGMNGAGRLEILDGADASFAIGSIGNYGAAGSALVDHGTWTLNGRLIAGFRAPGVLEIRNQGRVTAPELFIGMEGGSDGSSVVVEGAGSILGVGPPVWTSVPITIGGGGRATLSIRDQALVTSTGQVLINPNGGLDLEGGSLTAGSLTQSSGATVTGYGHVQGAVRSGGTVAPGSEEGGGVIEIVGDYVQESTGRLELDFSETGPDDLLRVFGTAYLDGLLTIRFDGPVSGAQRYQFIDATRIVVDADLEFEVSGIDPDRVVPDLAHGWVDVLAPAAPAAIPEPVGAGLALLGLAAAGAAVWRRRG